MSKDKEKEKINKRYNLEEREEIIKDICLQISLKGLSVRRIFRADNKNKPCINQDTFYEWLKNNNTFAERYARACEERAENLFEEILDIVDREDDDIIVDEEGLPRANHDVIQRDRLRMDARKWMLGKMNPKKYGDKIDIDANVNQNNNNVNHNIDYSKLSTETLTDLLNNIQKND